MNNTLELNSQTILSLDIGKSSVGFALVDKANNYKILNAGVRIFDAPEKPKEQTSLAQERGKFKRDRKHQENAFLRTKNIVKTMLKYNILDAKTIRDYNKSPKVYNCPKSKKKHLFYIKTAEYLFYKKANANNVLDLRVKALSSKLSKIELARLLYSINNHRGVTYEEIRDIPEGSTKTLSQDQKNLKDGFLRYKQEFQQHQDSYQTIGEYLYKEHKKKFRNKEKTSKSKKKIKDYYLFSIPRDDLKNEIEIIFEKQREFKSSFASKEFQDEYMEHFLWEKESPSYDTLVAPCVFNPLEKSASKHHISSLLYVAIETLYNVRYKKMEEKEYKNFSIEQIKQILNKSLKKLKGISYKDIKKILNLNNVEFKGVLDESKIVVNFETFIQVSKIFDLEYNLLEEFQKEDSFLHNDLVKIIDILAYTSKDSKKVEELLALNIDEQKVEDLIKVKFRGHLSYSLNVVKKMVNLMLAGLTPHKAKEEIKKEYGEIYIEKKAYLPPLIETDFPLKNNHTVVRALSQVRVVVNDILKYYRKKTSNSNWTFDTVTIELAREMNSVKQVKSINLQIAQNTKLNEEAKEFCIECGISNPTQNQTLKAKLWKMQNGIDPYVWIKSGENKKTEHYKLDVIELKRLFDEDYCQIEHTLPFVRSLDDSQSNKTLVLTKTNQDKGDRTPYEWLSKDEFEKFENYLREKKNYLAYGEARVRKLLAKDFNGIDGFKQRDIVDTQIISKYAGLYIDKYLKFYNNPNFSGKRRVYANNGKITTLLRKSWAIGKKNRDTHLHHAEDAILIACSTPSLIKNIATFINLQTQLTSSYITEKKFNYVLKNHKSLKDYILNELEKQNISLNDKDITSSIFKIIANKNYPYDGFREDFKTIIQNAPVTHFVKHKSNGSIHDETISKMKDEKTKGIKIREGIARNGAFVRCDVFKIINKRGKITYNFVVMTAQYNGKEIESLPTPKLKDGESAIFMFSVFKNDLLSYSLKDKTHIVGNFVKVASSIVVSESKNIENDLFKKQIKAITHSYSKTDDVSNLKEIINDKKVQQALKLDLLNVAKLSSQVEKVKALCKNVSRIVTDAYEVNIVFVMSKMSSEQTKKLREILISDGIVKDELHITQELKKTIFITLSEMGYTEAMRADGQTKLIDLTKLKVNALGEVVEKITLEKRKVM